MFRPALVAVFVFAVPVSPVLAQTPPSSDAATTTVAAEEGPRNTITTNLWTAYIAMPTVEYERALGSKLSVYAALGIGTGAWASPLGTHSVNFGPGAGLDLGARLFPFGRAPRGFFVGGYGGPMYVNGLVDGERNGLFGLNVFGICGYTFVIADRAVISLGAGAGYARMATANEVLFAGVLPTVRISGGVAF